MTKKLSAEDFEVACYKAMKIIVKLKLQAKQRVVYKMTIKRKHSNIVAVNLLNKNFNPVGQDQVLAGDITNLKTAEGWM